MIIQGISFHLGVMGCEYVGHGGEQPGMNVDDTGQEGAGFRGVSYGRSSIDLKARGLI